MNIKAKVEELVADIRKNPKLLKEVLAEYKK